LENDIKIPPYKRDLYFIDHQAITVVLDVFFLLRLGWILNILWNRKSKYIRENPECCHLVPGGFISTHF
jgi:hypothetical protein